MTTTRSHISWYVVGAAIPSLVSLIKTPVFTRHFSTEDFGEYGLVSIGFQFVGMLLFSWISSCLWRYFPQFNREKRLPDLYSHLLVLYLFSLILLTGITLTWTWFETESLLRDLILFSALQLGIYNCSQLYLVALRLQGKARSFGLFQMIRAVLILLLSLLMVFVLNQDIVALVSSVFLVDGLMLLLLILVDPPRKLFVKSMLERSLLMELIRYGSLGFLLNISFLMLTYCDRYIIAVYFDVNEVGIYDQAYKIAQFAMLGLTTVFFNSVSKSLFVKLETSADPSEYMAGYAFPLLSWGLPVVGFSIMCSEELANLLLGPSFRQGYMVMSWVFATMFLSAINQLYELSMKFGNRRRKLGLLVIFAAVLNLLLNLIFVPLRGYNAAAVTTFISYAFMTGVFYYWNQNLLTRMKPDLKRVMRMFLYVAGVFSFYFFMIKPIITTNLYKLGIALLFGTMYLWLFRNSLSRPFPKD